MRIAVGSDHRGFEVKKFVVGFLEKKHEIMDVGTHNKESCDYTDFAADAARLVYYGKAERAVLLCCTGMGMAITANKFPGVYACVCSSDFEAKRAREHNNANCICIPEQIKSEELKSMLESFVSEKFGGGRHERRVNKIKNIEDEFRA